MPTLATLVASTPKCHCGRGMRWNHERERWSCRVHLHSVSAQVAVARLAAVARKLLP